MLQAVGHTFCYVTAQYTHTQSPPVDGDLDFPPEHSYICILDLCTSISLASISKAGITGTRAYENSTFQSFSQWIDLTLINKT